MLRSDDFARGISKTYTLFRDVRQNKTYNIHPSSTKGLSNIRSGTPIRVRGTVESKHGVGVVNTHGDIHVREFEALSESVQQNNTAMNFRRLVMILVNLGKMNLECTASSMKDLLNGAHGWYDGIIGLTERNTGGVVTYSNDLFGDQVVDIYGPYDVPYDGTCTADVWANAALNAARVQGVDISAYQNRVFALPGAGEIYSTCGWHGLGNVGCDTCNAWVADCTTIEVFLHELGHNLGLPHAGSNWNQQGNLVEYGDPTSVMGNEWWVTTKDVTWYNLPEMDFLMGDAIDVVQVTESGDFKISAFDILPINVEHPQGMKVVHPDNGHLFYFSFHANETAYFAGEIVVHEFISQRETCYILRTMSVGDTFTDNLNRITVSAIAYDNAAYTLRVSYGCVVQPTRHELFMYTKSSTYDVTAVRDALPYAAGVTASFTLQIYNTDSPLCTPTTYNFSIRELDFPGGETWPVTFSPSELYLVPGQNCSVSISVPIPSTAEVGNYPIRVYGAASTGFLPTDHNIYFTLNTTLGTLPCVRHPPSCEILQGTTENYFLDYTLQIWNKDGFGCEPTEFVVNVTLPAGFSWPNYNTAKGKAVSIAAGHLESVPLRFGLLHDTEHHNFTFNVTSSSHNASTLVADIPPLTTSQCRALPPQIQVLDDLLDMETRSADSVLVSVTNRDPISCEGSTFGFSLPDATSQFARITLYPTFLYLLPGQVGYFYMMVAVPIFQTQTNFSIPIGAERLRERTTSYLSLSINPPPCVLSPLGAYSWCKNDDDVADGSIQCAGLIENHDSWNCPNLNLRVDALVPPGWNAIFEQPQLMTYNPGNSTWYWVNMSVPLDVAPGQYQYSFYGGEVDSDSSLHNFNTTYTLRTCNKTALTLTPSLSSLPLAAQGQTLALSLNIRNGNSIFCDGLQITLAAEIDAAAKGLVTIAFARNAFPLIHQTATDVDVTITANRTGILPVNAEDTVRMFTMYLTATDAKNETFYMAKVSFNLTVNLNCTFNSASVFLSPIYNELAAPGDSVDAIYTVGITNMDTPLCPPTQFYASFDSVKNFIPPGNVDAGLLAPNETFVTNVTFGVVDNTPPGLFNLTVRAHDRISATHTTSTRSNFTVGCPSPRPIFNLTAQQFTPFLQTKTAVQLSWNACENPVWCCCPCTWEIYRDGEKIGVSSGSNYTDQGRPAGSSNSYTAITIDKRGIRSPTNTTCLVHVEVSVRRPDLTKLFFFVGILFGSVLWVIGCAFLVVMFRKSLQDRINRAIDETALLLSEDGDIRDAGDEVEVEMNRQGGWTEADSRVSSEEGEDGEDPIEVKDIEGGGEPDER